jgi:hypothetical protein
MSKVKVSIDAGGNHITASSTPGFGYIRLVQSRPVFNEQNFLKIQTVSSLVHGTLADLRSLGWEPNAEIPGNLVIKESVVPFNKKDPDRDLKIAGKTGIVCSLNGQPIYRKAFYDKTGLQEDVLVQHDNIEEIRQAFAAIEEAEETDLGQM